MELNDALFNWLQIKIVWDKRPSDRSARDTVRFFEEVLEEKHQVKEIEKRLEKEQYVLEFEQNGKKQTVTFPKELAEKLYQDILAEPRYNQHFDD
jgi:hypothetical protein